MVVSNLRANGNCKSVFLLTFVVHMKRDGEYVRAETFEDFRRMKREFKVPESGSVPDTTATIMFKDDKYWAFHSPIIEDAEMEKTDPGQKLWLVMRHMGADPDHQFKPEQGYKLTVGDTIKFGRVRYKVIMLHNFTDGLQEYSLLDRFQRRQFKKHLKNSGLKKKRSRVQPSAGYDGMQTSPSRQIHHMPTMHDGPIQLQQEELGSSLFLESSEDLSELHDEVPEQIDGEASNYGSDNEHGIQEVSPDRGFDEDEDNLATINNPGGLDVAVDRVDN